MITRRINTFSDQLGDRRWFDIITTLPVSKFIRIKDSIRIDYRLRPTTQLRLVTGSVFYLYLDESDHIDRCPDGGFRRFSSINIRTDPTISGISASDLIEFINDYLEIDPWDLLVDSTRVKDLVDRWAQRLGVPAFYPNDYAPYEWSNIRWTTQPRITHRDFVSNRRAGRRFYRRLGRFIGSINPK
jgi:hypothetical protein